MRITARCLASLLGAFIFCFPAKAQELWGASNSNYAGTMGLDLNPASIVGAPYKWEVHLVSADVSLLNNYLFLKKKSKPISTLRAGNSLSPDRIAYKNITTDKFANLQAFAKLPAFIFSKNNWGIGFHISTRMALSVRGIPYHLANFMKEGFDFTPQQKKEYNGGNAKIVGMNWHEAGLTGGLALLNTERNYLTAGLTLNYLQGLNSFYFLLDDINYNVQADTLWQIFVAQAEYGHAVAEENNPTGSGIFTKRGTDSEVHWDFNFIETEKRRPTCLAIQAN